MGKIVRHLKTLGFFAGRRMLFFYLLIFLFLNTGDYFKKGLAHARAQAISRLRPDLFDYFLKAEDLSPKTIDRGEMRDYERYFEKIVEVWPNVSEGYALLGFCRYHLGKEERAIEAYRRAAQSMPKLVSFQYNLGALYFKQGGYERATQIFAKALACDVKEVIPLIANSRLLRPVIAVYGDNISDRIHGKLRNVYLYSYTLIAVSYYHLKDFQKMFNYSNKAIGSGIDTDGRFSYYAGLASYQMKRYEQALVFFQNASNKNQASAEAYCFLGLSLRALGKEEMAAFVLKQAAVLADRQEAATFMNPEVKIVIF